jgi:hypothetical protein
LPAGRRQKAAGSVVIRYSLFERSVAMSCLDDLNDFYAFYAFYDFYGFNDLNDFNGQPMSDE